MQRMRSCVFLSTLLFCHFAFSQSASLTAFQQRIAEAFEGSTTRFPGSVTLSGNATWSAGSLQESGAVNLQLSSDGSTSEAWTLPTVPHSWTQGPIDFATLSRSCLYTDAGGQQHNVLGSNCLQGMNWFFPGFVLQPTFASALTLSDQTTSDDASQGLIRLTYALSLSQFASTSSAMSPLAQNTAFSVFYSATTALPVRVMYQQVSDTDESIQIAIDIEFSDYRPEGGLVIPHHIQRYIQHTLNADVTIMSATIE